MSLERRQSILGVAGRLVVRQPGLAPATRHMCVDDVYWMRVPSGMRTDWEQLQPGRALAWRRSPGSSQAGEVRRRGGCIGSLIRSRNALWVCEFTYGPYSAWSR
jgi:hypothetical protein